ncbi:MAG: BrnT family toxin [Silicimonas sp.]|nr:BrnT family toxin [Silicimonas sp.]
MEFEWDEKKRVSNMVKHGVDFLMAALIFEGRVLTRRDERKDYGEDRFVSLGMVDGAVYSVTHTKRGDKIRIISAWQGGRKEYEHYQNSNP